MSGFKRIILITVDCLRADHVGCISGVNLTPNIDRLAKESTVFTRAFSNGPATTQSFTAILTSTYFLMHGDMRLSHRYITLAEVLSNNGFRTVAFHSNPFLSKMLGWNRGFSEFYDFMDIVKIPSAAFIRSDRSAKLVAAIDTVTGILHNKRLLSFLRKVYYNWSKVELPYVDGRQINEHVFSWLNQHKKDKFFLWIHYMDPHRPYVPPPPYCLPYFESRKEALMFDASIHSKITRSDISNNELEKLKGLYRGEVRYLDERLGELIEFLERLGMLADSLILLTADHGEPFMEHKKFEHDYDVIYNEAIHVPLIIYGLTNHPTKIHDYVQLLDIAPTILEAIGIRKPKSFMGNSLIPLLEGKKQCTPIFSESAKPDLTNLTYDTNKKVVSCIAEGWKLIINDFWGTTELYNIEKDPYEKNDLATTELEIRQQLTTIIQEHLTFEKMKSKDAKIRERLRILRDLKK